jgi:hypothetical protein
MINYEQFVFFCSCGEELRTKVDRTITCTKCTKSYEIEVLPFKYLIPKEKKLATIND